MLPGRTALFVIWQAVIALILTLMGSASGWQEAAGWWPIVAFLTNVVSIFWLWSLFHAEGRRFLHIFQIKRETLKKDVVFLLAMLVISGPVAMGPNILLATWLFGDQQAALDLLLRPLPFWAVLFSIVLWPLTQSFAELPFYFGYLMPRLERQSGRWTAVLASAFWLGAQHAALPLIFNGRLLPLAPVDVPAFCPVGRCRLEPEAPTAALHGRHSRSDGFDNGLDDSYGGVSIRI